ncbi:sodium/hydrogen exchanger 6 [Tanacetum coccineum]|uniref:Sodium/hydrogen exchanger 6 n=1 Tax=Tanacetum coccineum TaxID=301880 RepID=A0ABQ5EG88_9ASTR
MRQKNISHFIILEKNTLRVSNNINATPTSMTLHIRISLKVIVSGMFLVEINNGKSTSAWFDRWAEVCPLKGMFSNRDIARSGFSLDDSVNNLISDGVWRWPLDWLSSLVSSLYPSSCYTYVVGFQQKLKTQDRLRQWDVGLSIDLNLLRCPLCDLVPVSNDHLFFECAFSLQVWSKVRVLCGMDSIPPQLIEVTYFITPISKGKTMVSILSRLVLAATSYYIWLERNGRLFKKKTSSPNQIVDVIISMVRLKLVTFKFKKMSTRSRLLLDQWKIPSYYIVHDGSSRDKPWVLLGDFNAALNLEDHSCGGYKPNIAMREFKECVQNIEVMDVNCTGLHFTWIQKPKGSNGILKNIDRIMGNLQFNDEFPGSFTIFQPYQILDHSPCVLRIPKEMDEIQKAIDKEPNNSDLRDEHAHYLLAFKEASLDEERFLRHKSKIQWLNAGDSNTAYFHRIVKSKCARNRIEMVRDSSNILYEGNAVVGAFVTHYENFPCIEGSNTPLVNQDLFYRVIDSHRAEFRVRDVTDTKFKDALFSMGDDKSPGPDGFTSAFFKKAWDVVGNLDDLVSINQSAFVLGRRISDNILLTQDLMRNYHQRRGPPRCAFKVDIQKAYDTVDWAFLKSILIGFGFHYKMVDWIMTCVSTTSYSVCVKGDLHGWFRGKRGLRQGDPLSLYLFTLVIEILTLILQQKVYNFEVFQYHHLCEKQKIINLCFADDLFLFARGHSSSVDVIMQGLEEFKNVSGLVPSIPKSTAFFCNVPSALKASILNSMPFTEGFLPVRASVFILPARIIHDLEKLMRAMEMVSQLIMLPEFLNGLLREQAYFIDFVDIDKSRARLCMIRGKIIQKHPLLSKKCRFPDFDPSRFRSYATRASYLMSSVLVSPAQHREAVNVSSIKWSPDGSLLGVGYSKHLIWDARSGLIRHNLQVVIALASGDRGQGFDSHSLQGRSAARARQVLFDGRDDSVIGMRFPNQLGVGLSNLEYGYLCEIMGHFVWVARVFNCGAPDTGNMEVPLRYGTKEQLHQWLIPLLNGTIRSGFILYISNGIEHTQSIQNASKTEVGGGAWCEGSDDGAMMIKMVDRWWCWLSGDDGDVRCGGDGVVGNGVAFGVVAAAAAAVDGGDGDGRVAAVG